MKYEAMRFNGTIKSAKEICKWANQGNTDEGVIFTYITHHGDKVNAHDAQIFDHDEENYVTIEEGCFVIIEANKRRRAFRAAKYGQELFNRRKGINMETCLTCGWWVRKVTVGDGGHCHAVKASPSTMSFMIANDCHSWKPRCDTCAGTGYYGDNGPGIKCNREYQRCECGCPPTISEPRS